MAKTFEKTFTVLLGVGLLMIAGLLILFSASSMRRIFNEAADSSHHIVTDASARFYEIVLQSTERVLVDKAKSQAHFIESRINEAMDAARTISQLMAGLKAKGASASGINRDRITMLLRGVIAHNDDFMGIYTCWEPDRFDGNALAYENLEGHDFTGRFIPYWFRNSLGELSLHPQTHYTSLIKDDNGVRQGEYYLAPRERREECLIDPFIKKIDGETVWCTSLVSPIIVDQEFYGVAGVDLRLKNIQLLAQSVSAELYGGSGQVLFISNNGTVVADSSNPDHIGLPMERFRPDTWALESQYMYSTRHVSEIADGMISVYFPLKIGRATTPWMVNILLPESVVTKEARQITQKMKDDLENLTAMTRKESERSTRIQMLIGGCVGLVVLVLIIFLVRKEMQIMRDAKKVLQLEVEERKKTTAALAKSEERYRLIAENVGDVIWTMDMDLKFTYISPSIYQQQGYTVEQAIQLSLDTVLRDAYEEVVSLFKRKIDLIKAGDPRGWEPAIFEIKQFCFDNSLIWTHNSARILTGADRKPASILGITRDITERVLAEQAVKESEKKYRNLFESSMDAIVLLDLETGYLDCNPAALDLFGFQSKEQIIGLTPMDLSPTYQPDGGLSSKKAGRMIHKALDRGSMLFEWTHKRLNGDTFFASVLATRLKIGGKTLLQGTIRDISEYKRTQEMMIQSEKMLSVGGLAAGMAHEINNPLAGMIQNASVISNRLTDIEMPANQKAAKEIGIDMADIQLFMEKRGIGPMTSAVIESGRRMAAIVKNMLSFARKSDAVVSSHRLSDLLDKTLELAAADFDLKKHYDFKRIEIRKEHDDTVPAVPCEGAKIQQVLLNILKNGAQAMQEARTEKPCFIIRIQNDRARQMVCMEIEDNGPGMDEKTRRRVFEPFYTTKPAGVGTGLGLSVSYFIITENHHGELSVESTPGSGTKFIIRLPLEGRTADV